MSREDATLGRRRFIALPGLGGLAGCSSLGGNEPETGTPTETSAQSPQPTRTPTLTPTPTPAPEPTETETETETDAAPYDVERNVMVEMRDGVVLY